MHTTNHAAHIIASMRKDIGGMENVFKTWDDSTAELMHIALKVAHLSEKVHEYTSGPEYVIHDATKLCHRVLSMRPKLTGFPLVLCNLAVRGITRIDAIFTL